MLRLDRIGLDEPDFFGCLGPRDLFVLRVHSSPPHSGSPTELREFFKWQEYANLIRGLEAVFPRRQFVNRPSAVLAAGSKPLQLLVARGCGFRTPRTLFTNSRKALRRFASEQTTLGKRSVVKSIDTPIAPNPSRPGDSLILFTRELSPTDFGAGVDGSDDLGSPVIAQELVPKDHELRVAVFGTRSVWFAIDSQRFPDSSIDWRWRVSDTSLLRRVEPDAESLAMLRDFLDRMDLETGVFDLVITPDGDLVFLECNPHGQWQGMDERTGGSGLADYAAFLRDTWEAMI